MKVSSNERLTLTFRSTLLLRLHRCEELSRKKEKRTGSVREGFGDERWVGGTKISERGRETRRADLPSLLSLSSRSRTRSAEEGGGQAES